MYADPKMIYPNTDAGKQQLIADLNVKVARDPRRLPDYFGALPKADVTIKRVPKEIEAGQAAATTTRRPWTGRSRASTGSTCATPPSSRAGSCRR